MEVYEAKQETRALTDTEKLKHDNLSKEVLQLKALVHQRELEIQTLQAKVVETLMQCRDVEALLKQRSEEARDRQHQLVQKDSEIEKLRLEIAKLVRARDEAVEKMRSALDLQSSTVIVILLSLLCIVCVCL